MRITEDSRLEALAHVARERNAALYFLSTKLHGARPNYWGVVSSFTLLLGVGVALQYARGETHKDCQTEPN